LPKHLFTFSDKIKPSVNSVNSSYIESFHTENTENTETTESKIEPFTKEGMEFLVNIADFVEEFNLK